MGWFRCFGSLLPKPTIFRFESDSHTCPKIGFILTLDLNWSISIMGRFSGFFLCLRKTAELFNLLGAAGAFPSGMYRTCSFEYSCFVAKWEGARVIG